MAGRIHPLDSQSMNNKDPHVTKLGQEEINSGRWSNELKD